MLFQSSPSPKTGRYAHQLPPLHWQVWFQSSPSPKTGRYDIPHWWIKSQVVPILTQSENWALFLQSLGILQHLGKYRSNPHPVRKLGAILTESQISLVIRAFQSSPSPKTGRYFKRMRFFCLGIGEFQSSPSPKTGRYILLRFKIFFNFICSNPHPVRKLGATQSNRSLHLVCQCSNPHPVRKLGATMDSIRHTSID